MLQYCLAYDGEIIASGSSDSCVKIWTLGGKLNSECLLLGLCFIYQLYSFSFVWEMDIKTNYNLQIKRPSLVELVLSLKKVILH